MYEAIFIPEGVSSPSKDIINQPVLQVYVKDFSRNKGDLCLVAQVRDKIIGAAWIRIMNDYGHIDNETPSFAISLLKEYKNYGIGTELMKQMLTKLKLICNYLLSRVNHRKSPQTFIKLFLKTSGKSSRVSVPGLGHSDIRGLVTYRSMVRRELYRLVSWITDYSVLT